MTGNISAEQRCRRPVARVSGRPGHKRQTGTARSPERAVCCEDDTEGAGQATRRDGKGGQRGGSAQARSLSRTRRRQRGKSDDSRPARNGTWAKGRHDKGEWLGGGKLRAPNQRASRAGDCVNGKLRAQRTTEKRGTSLTTGTRTEAKLANIKRRGRHGGVGAVPEKRTLRNTGVPATRPGWNTKKARESTH